MKLSELERLIAEAKLGYPDGVDPDVRVYRGDYGTNARSAYAAVNGEDDQGNPQHTFTVMAFDYGEEGSRKS